MRHAPTRPSMVTDLFQTLAEVCAPRTEAEVDACYTVALALGERLDYDTASRAVRLLTTASRDLAAFERAERWPDLFARPRET